MAGTTASSDPNDAVRLLDENEQLRALLESALEENASLLQERDWQAQHITSLLQELHSSRALVVQHEEHARRAESADLRQNRAEEALRVAFEELQVLTEELEVANTGLLRSNQELDARVEERTWQLKEINSSLLATEASLRAMADLVPDLLWRANAKGDADWFNRRWSAYTGRSSADWLGLGWLEALHRRDRHPTRAAWRRAMASGRPFERECRIRNENGDYRWFLVRAEPLLGAGGKVVRWFAAATDMHARRLALDALQRSELRFRTLVEGMPQLVWRAQDEGYWTWSSRQWSDYTGQDEAAANGMGWLQAFHPEDRESALGSWRRAAETGALEIEGRIFHAPENRHRHFRTRARAVRDSSDRVLEWLGTSTDVDDILQLQEQQNLLVAELQHRTRNLMAVVQLIMARTLAGSTSLEDFADRIGDRLAALARVQGLLSQRETGARVPFDRLVREELAAHVDLLEEGPGRRITLDGPAGVPLRSSTVQTFALVLHELVTNAVKYGALGKGGRLRVSWGVKPSDGGDPQLWVDWRETGVPDMPPPDSPARGGGFGRELIERALPYQLGARTTYELTPDGAHCTIEVAVPDSEPVLEKTHA